MLYEIISNGAVAQIDTKGAELQSIKDVFGTEYIWNGDARFWSRRAPVLFPIIGAQKEGKFEYEGKTYLMKNHGFARDLEFEMQSHDKNSILFSLVTNKNILDIYPFKFRFQISYSLEGTVLTVEYRVANIGENEMYFCVGAHTAFNCPIIQNECFEDYVIEFMQNEDTSRMLLNEKGLYSGEKIQLFNGDRSIRLNHELFDCDAIVPEHLKSKSVTMKSEKSGRGVKVDYEGFDNCAVWSPRGSAHFVCLEPWNGRASGVNDSCRLEEKQGIIKLDARAFYRVSFTISLL